MTRLEPRPFGPGPRRYPYARSAISKLGGNPDHENIVWHAVANDNAWMRDNGPVYVVEDGEMRIQNWAFDAWGGAFGADVAMF